MQIILFIAAACLMVKIINTLRINNLTLKFQNELLKLRGTITAYYFNEKMSEGDQNAFLHLYRNVYLGEKILGTINVWLIAYAAIRDREVAVEHKDKIIEAERLIEASSFRNYYSRYLQLSNKYLRSKSVLSWGLVVGIIYFIKKCKILFKKSIKVKISLSFTQKVKDIATSLEYNKNDGHPFNYC